MNPPTVGAINEDKPEMDEFLERKENLLVCLDIWLEKVALPPQNMPDAMPMIKPKSNPLLENTGNMRSPRMKNALKTLPMENSVFALMYRIKYVDPIKKMS